MIQNIGTYSEESQYLFGRTYSLAIGSPYSAAALQYSNLKVTGASGKMLIASPLRVSFDIEKNNIGSPNKGKIEVYNLSAQARNQIQKGAVLTLQAGYGKLIQTIFVGNILNKGVKIERRQNEIVTTLEGGDGESAISAATLDKSYPPGTNLSQVLQDIADSMHTPTTWNNQGIGAGIAVGIPNIVYGKGITVHGACRDTLNTLLQPLGVKWSVQNGNLTLISSKANNGDSAIVVSKYTGMIGTPSKSQFLCFQSLLNPQLVPNAIIQLISDNTALNGFYKINKSHYEGDTHDTKWQVSCECSVAEGVSQTLPASAGFDYSSAEVPA